MYQLARETKLTALALLTEGNSIRSVERITGAHRDTIMRLGVRAGQAAARFMSETMVNLPCERVEIDEQWTFVGKKQRRLNVTDDESERGDFWIWSAIDADTKAVPTFRVGKRDRHNAHEFVCDLAWRLRNRVQLSADGLAFYVDAIERAFGGDVDFGTIVKTYEGVPAGEGRYGPPRVSSVTRETIVGNPQKPSTSMIERLHLSNRMRCRRLTRLVDAFSKKRENLEAAVGLNYFAYNFVRRHGAHKLTPAQAVGVTRDPLRFDDLLDYDRAI